MAESAGFLQADRTSVIRSMVLYGAGALIGLAIAGYGLFTAQGTSTRSVPPENVATVNGRPLLRSDFITQLENELGMPFEQSTREDQLKVLDEMVREELLVQRGLELDFGETDQDTRNALVTAMSQQAVAQAVMSQPSEKELMDYFEAHHSDFDTLGEVTVSDLLLPKSASLSAPDALAKAREAVAALRGGASVEQVKARFGMSEVKREPEDWYWAAKIHFGDKLYASLVTLDDGQVTEPVETDDGIHVVKMLKNKRPQPTTFEQSRSQVAADFKSAAQDKMTEDTIRFLRERAQILIATDYADYKP